MREPKSTNDHMCILACAKCSIEIGPPNYNLPILGKNQKIVNPPNITPTNSYFMPYGNYFEVYACAAFGNLTTMISDSAELDASSWQGRKAPVRYV